MDEPVAVACVYVCMYARALSCTVATFPQAVRLALSPGLRRFPTSSLFQRRRPIAVCVLYSPAIFLFQRRRLIAVCVLYSPAIFLFQRRRLIAVCVLYSPPALSLFQLRRPIAVCVLYSPPALSLFQLRRPIAVCCSVLSGVGRQPALCLVFLQQARWLGLQQARCGVVAVVYIPQKMRPLLASG